MGGPWDFSRPNILQQMPNLVETGLKGFAQGRSIADDYEKRRLIDEAMQNAPGGQLGLGQLANIAARTGDMGNALHAFGLSGQTDLRNLQAQQVQQEMDFKRRTLDQQDQASKALSGLMGGGQQQPMRQSLQNNTMKTTDPVASGLKPYEAAFLNGVAGPESAGKYNIRYTPQGGATFEGFAQHPGIREAGPHGPSTAAGRYQFTKTTWDGLPPEAKGDGSFSPENQDRAALFLARRDYKAKTGRDDFDQQLQTPGGFNAVARVLATTWAGFADNPAKAIDAFDSSMQRYERGGQPQQANYQQSTPPVQMAQAGQQQAPMGKQGMGDAGLPIETPALRNYLLTNGRFLDPTTKSVLEGELKRREARDEPTNDTKNFREINRQRVANGQTPYSSQDAYELELAKAKKTEVNIDQKGEGEEQKGLGKQSAESIGELSKSAQMASNNLARLRSVSSMLDQVSTGKLDPGRMNMAQWGRSLGMNDDILKNIGLDPKAAATGQAVQSMLNQMVMGSIGPGGIPANNFSNTDRMFIQETMPQLSNDPRANTLIIDAMRRVEELKIEKAKSFREFKKANPKSYFDEFETEWAAKQAGLNRFDDLRQKAEALSGPARPQPTAQMQEGMTATNPQTGQKIMLRGGQWVPAQ